MLGEGWTKPQKKQIERYQLFLSRAFDSNLRSLTQMLGEGWTKPQNKPLKMAPTHFYCKDMGLIQIKKTRNLEATLKRFCQGDNLQKMLIK